MTDTIEKLMEVATNLVSRIEALKSGKQFPQVGDRYWMLLCGSVSKTVYHNDATDRHRMAIGNFFRAEQEAQSELYCQLVENELRCCEGRIDNVDYVRYGIAIHRQSKLQPSAIANGANALFSIYYTDLLYVEEAIEKVGKERIKAAATWKATRPVY